MDVCDEDKDRYRFGFNGQEKVNEIAGIGNHNTAEFWEYDTRLGRRWNLDPVDQVDISNYAVNLLNPISFNDPNGDVVPLVVGVYYGATILYATWATYQVNKYYQENSSKPYIPPIRSRSDNSPQPEAAKPAKNGSSTKVEKSDFQKIQDKWGDAQSRVSKTPQRTKQASANSGHAKSKAAPVRPKAAPTSIPKPQIRLAEQNDEPQPQEARLSPESSTDSETPDLVGDRKIHILNRHRAGAGKPSKTEFPEDWSDEKIIEETNKIANDADAPSGTGRWDSPYKTGTVDGIDIRVDFYPPSHENAGKVSTAYPTNTTPNPPKEQ